MKKELSVYLDLLRLSAAMLVFASHLSWRAISGGFLWQIQSLGHSAVIVFFVLSGFVIQFAADKKERDLPGYLAARFARLYSVVLPAMILTVICDGIGTAHNPASYHMGEETTPLLRLALGSTFLTQSWQRVSLLSNDPFWSLPYEFWYYLIFGAAFFLKGRSRIIAVALACLIAGPAILLLFPIWLLGVFGYRISQKTKLTRPRLIWIISTTGIMIAIWNNQHQTESVSVLLPRAYSVLDYVIGALVAVNMVAASQLDFGLTSLRRPVAYLAGMTFALYLFHLPLLHLAAAYMPRAFPVPLRAIVAAAFTLSVVYGLSFVTERQKGKWQALFQRLFLARQKSLALATIRKD
jgi:peptidoglycan/LPS O-acetylase OafA/YrhL